MKPYCQHSGATLYHGDCLSVLPALGVLADTVITDPPYHLTQLSRGGSPRQNDPETPFGRTRLGSGGFMGKTWDGGDVAFRPETWATVAAVCKPGAMLLAFGGTRTWHRLACAIEDAGWEIRDTICWLYGQGFPKSLDISKAIDKSARREYVLAAIELGLSIPGRSVDDWTKESHSPSDKWWNEFKRVIPMNDWKRIERAVVGNGSRVRGNSVFDSGFPSDGQFEITAPQADAAKLWSGWGTALKPAFEPIIVAMKPLDGTFAQNAVKHGVAGLNIDGGRIGTSKRTPGSAGTSPRFNGKYGECDARTTDGSGFDPNIGRFPANLILDEEAAALLDESTGECGGHDDRGVRNGSRPSGFGNVGTESGDGKPCGVLYPDFGGASRFFYTAKASRSERGKGNTHPTVKPMDLMRYLCRLTSTPTGGLVLDPFAGSGTTLIAAFEEGRECIGIEMEESHCEIAARRIKAATKQQRLNLGA